MILTAAICSAALAQQVADYEPCMVDKLKDWRCYGCTVDCNSPYWWDAQDCIDWRPRLCDFEGEDL